MGQRLSEVICVKHLALSRFSINSNDCYYKYKVGFAARRHECSRLGTIKERG